MEILHLCGALYVPFLPPLPKLAYSTGLFMHVSHTMTINHSNLSFPSIFVLLGGMCSYVHVYGG